MYICMHPQALTQQGEQLQKGEQAYKSKNGVMALAYKDKRVVLLLNTAYSASEGTTIKQLNMPHNNNSNIPPTYTHIPAPLAVAAYRQYMGGVDRFTSFLAYYICGFRSSKWWLRLFYQFLDIAIVNAFIISKQSAHTANKWRTQKEFRLELCTALINNKCYRQKKGRPTHTANTSSATRTHHLGISSMRRRCQQSGCKRVTTQICQECNIGICHYPCFDLFHAY